MSLYEKLEWSSNYAFLSFWDKNDGESIGGYPDGFVWGYDLEEKTIWFRMWLTSHNLEKISSTKLVEMAKWLQDELHLAVGPVILKIEGEFFYLGRKFE